MVFGEGRRVEDDQVVFVADVLEILHGVGRNLAEIGLPAEVEHHVFGGECHGAFGGVHRAYLSGAARHGVDRESARVTEGVEHRAAFGVAFHQFAVFALVEEKARLLAFLPVYEEFLAVFRHDVRFVVGAAPQITVHGAQPGVERHRLRTFVVDGRDFVAVSRPYRLGDLHAGVVHADRVALDHGRRAVDVHDQSRQGVALAVHQPVAVRVGIVRKSQRAANVVRHGDAAVPPLLIDRLPAERQHAHGDRTDLVVSLRDEFARTGVYFDQSAFGDFRFVFGLDVVDGPRKNPRVAAHKRLFLAFAQVDLRCHALGRFILGVCSSLS